MVSIPFVWFQHWLDVTKSIKKQVKSKFIKSRASAVHAYIWCVCSGSFFCLYFVTHSMTFWAFFLCLLVGPPYCLHMRVKFYSSEPNNLHEELTRSMRKHLWAYLNSFHTWFILVFTNLCAIWSLQTPWNYRIKIALLSFFFQISICLTVEARHPQWKVSTF